MNANKCVFVSSLLVPLLVFPATYLVRFVIPFAGIAEGKYCLVFSSPEMILGDDKPFRRMLTQPAYEKLCCVAIDESNIVHEW